MSGIGQYIFSVIMASLFISLLTSVIPAKSAVAGCIRSASGIFISLVIVSPLLKMRLNDISNYISSIETSAAYIITEAENYRTDATMQVIKQKLESYILNKASALGAEIETELTLRNDNSYVPERITITGPISPFVKRQLSAFLVEEIGIAEENQTWKLS